MVLFDRMLFGLVLLFSGAAYAGALDDLEVNSRDITLLAGTFSQTRHVEGIPLPLVSKGKFRFVRHNGVVWHTTSPVNTELLIRRDGVYAAGGSPEQPIPGSAVIAELLLAIFSGNTGPLKDHFAIANSENDSPGIASPDNATSETEIRWTLRLRPLSATVNSYLDYVELKGAKQVEEVRVFEVNGDRSRIVLNIEEVIRQQANAP